MRNKLVRVERSVNVYYKSSKEPSGEINIDIIPFDKLINFVTPKEDDPLLYDGYQLDEKQLNEINKFIDNKIVVDFKKYYYYLECSGIYDWQ